MNHKKYLTDDEYNALLTKIQETQGRDSLLFGLLLVTGARASEVLKLEVGDIDVNGSKVFLRGLKGSLDRDMPLPPWLMGRLVEYVGSRRGRVFDIGYRRLYDIWLGFRVCSKKIHALRHTYAVRGYRRSKDIRLIQGALGHRWLSTTMIYQTYEHSVEERRALL